VFCGEFIVFKVTEVVGQYYCDICGVIVLE